MSRAAIFFVASTATLPGLPSQKQNQQTESDHGTTPFICICIYLFLFYLYTYSYLYIYFHVGPQDLENLYSYIKSTPTHGSNLFITSVSLRILRAATFGFPTFVTLDSVPVVHLATKTTQMSHQPLLSSSITSLPKSKDLENLRLFSYNMNSRSFRSQVHPSPSHRKTKKRCTLSSSASAKASIQALRGTSLEACDEIIQPNPTESNLSSPINLQVADIPKVCNGFSVEHPCGSPVFVTDWFVESSIKLWWKWWNETMKWIQIGPELHVIFGDWTLTEKEVPFFVLKNIYIYIHMYIHIYIYCDSPH